MATSIRLSRGGSKKRPYYRIVVADSRSPRDGKFIERIGSYNPLLAKTDEKRIVLDAERAKYWVDQGAQPTDRVARFLDAAGVKERAARNNPNKAKPGAKATERAEDKAAKIAEAEEAKVAAAAAAAEAAEAAAAAAAPAPAEEETAPVEEVAAEAEAAPAEEAVNEATPNSDAGEANDAEAGESAQTPAEG